MTVMVARASISPEEMARTSRQASCEAWRESLDLVTNIE